jgi:hypothetical protein
MWNKSFLLIILAAGLTFALVAGGAKPGPAVNGKTVIHAPVNNEKAATAPTAVNVSPGELDLGVIGPGQSGEGKYTLRGISPAPLPWSTHGPERWSTVERHELRSFLDGGVAEFSVKLRVLPREGALSLLYPVRLTLETGAQSIVCMSDLQPGIYREAVKLFFTGGETTVYFHFRIIRPESEPFLEIESPRIDFGKITAGQKVSKVIKVTNKGRSALRWRLDVATAENGQLDADEAGRYISFFNDTAKGHEMYSALPHLRQSLEFTGNWYDHAGYPRAEAESGALRCSFFGTGLSVLFWRGPKAGILLASIDDAVHVSENGRAPFDEEAEILVADNLPPGNHMLTITTREGDIVLEGVRIYGVSVLQGKSGAVRFSPASGVTMRETDYVNVTVDTQPLKPGVYDEKFLVSSNGGDESVEVSFEVIEAHVVRLLDVFRYLKGSDYVYTAMPQAEAAALAAGGYVKQGVAFRLFNPGTPGTTEFFRWFNPDKVDHYYSYDYASAGFLKGYRYEGAIGNIATSRLTATRPLYRWQHLRTGRNFYTTDANAEGHMQKGYRFQGIAGYVR